MHFSGGVEVAWQIVIRVTPPVAAIDVDFQALADRGTVGKVALLA